MQKIADEYKREAEDFDADLVSDSDGNYCFLSQKYQFSCNLFYLHPHTMYLYVHANCFRFRGPS